MSQTTHGGAYGECCHGKNYRGGELCEECDMWVWGGCVPGDDGEVREGEGGTHEQGKVVMTCLLQDQDLYTNIIIH